jgi:hypothetical protein
MKKLSQQQWENIARAAVITTWLLLMALFLFNS